MAATSDYFPYFRARHIFKHLDLLVYYYIRQKKEAAYLYVLEVCLVFFLRNEFQLSATIQLSVV